MTPTTKRPAVKFETWMQSRWRPMMGWMYMAVCIFDFILFPIGHAWIQYIDKTTATQQITQWVPLTMSGAGLFHMAMGAVLGIYVWSRGQEKMQGIHSSSIPQYSEGPYSRRPQGYETYEYENTVDRMSTVQTAQKATKDPKRPSNLDP